MESTPAPAGLFDWRAAIAQSSLTPNTRHVLLTLSLYMDTDGGSAFPGARRLSSDSGRHMSTVKRCLAEAREAAYLIVIEKGGAPFGGQRRATEYQAATPVDNYGDWYSPDPGHTATGSEERDDWYSDEPGPVATGDPISSVITPIISSAKVSSRRVENCTPPPWLEKGERPMDWVRR